MATTDSERTVLLTAISMTDLGGSTMYVRDLALRLRAIGHRPVVYTPQIGPVADELRHATIPVIESFDGMSGPPDVIHGNHTVETVEASLRFPGVPIVFVCHGWDAWMAEPPILSAITHFVGVTRACRDRMAVTAGVPEQRCSVLPNGVDAERFALRHDPLPPTPRRALVFSNNAVDGGWLESVRTACSQRGIDVDVIGSGVGRPEPHPERVLAEFDLVFARGRCALEAMSSGAAVVLCDAEGLGPMVTLDAVDDLRQDGLGRRVLSDAHDVELMGRQIDRYDASDATAVAHHVREVGSLAGVTASFVEIYDESIAQSGQLTVDPAADLAWLVDYLPTLSRLGHERDQALLASHRQAQHAGQLAARLADYAATLETTHAEFERVSEQVQDLIIQLDGARSAADELARLRSSRWVRLGDRLRGLPVVRTLRRLSRRANP